MNASSATPKRPNVVLLLADDLGYSDIAPFGGEIQTPSLTGLASEGTSYTQFYNTARCSPSRASLLTGRHPHDAGVGILTGDTRPNGYRGEVHAEVPMLSEVLRDHGYRTYLAGKWHLANQVHEPTAAWPTRRGFDDFFGTITGGGSYYSPTTLTRGTDSVEPGPGFYYTDAIGNASAGFVTEHASGDRSDEPFFLFTSFTAPHWPLHAPESVVGEYSGTYEQGWDVLREKRFERATNLGIVGAESALTGRDSAVPSWESLSKEQRSLESRRMAIYAAQVQIMDANIGKILETLETSGIAGETIVLFLSDNGGCSENLPVGWVDELPQVQEWSPSRTGNGVRVRSGNEPDRSPGGPETFQSYGRAWANLSNAPFREYKHWVHEGGISTPLIIRYPDEAPSESRIVSLGAQLPDIAATILSACGLSSHDLLAATGHPSPQGQNLKELEADPTRASERYLFWEHEGNAAVRQGRWKAVRKFEQPWELYDMQFDRSELSDQAKTSPEVLSLLIAQYNQWADEHSVGDHRAHITQWGETDPLWLEPDPLWLS